MARLFLKHTHFSLALGTHTAGGHVGYAAVGKADPGIGNVNVRSQHSGTGTVHTFKLAIDQRQDQVDIVNHQVEQHTHVCGTRLERRQTRTVNEPGIRQQRLQCQSGRVKALQVSNRQHAMVFFGQTDQLIRLFQCGGHGLFDQDMHARSQKLDTHIVMALCGHRDADRIDLAKQCPVVCQSSAVQRACNGIGLLLSVVHHSNELTFRNFGVLLGMKFTQITNANHGTTQQGHRALLSSTGRDRLLTLVLINQPNAAVNARYPLWAKLLQESRASCPHRLVLQACPGRFEGCGL